MPVVCDNRKKYIDMFVSNNIEVRPLIAGNMGNKPLWYNNYQHVELPNCEIIDKKGFYLPNHQDLSHNDIITICNILNA